MSITRLGHIAFTVCDLDRSARFAQEVIGLREVQRTDTTAYLTSTSRHHQLRLRAGDTHACEEIAFDVSDADGFDTLRRRVADAGLEISDDEDALFDRVLRFSIPDGPTVALCLGAAPTQATHYSCLGARPRKLGHVTVASPASERIGEVLSEVLGMRLSDRLPLGEHAEGDLTWYRCNADHHSVGVTPSETAGIHHYAFALDGFAAFGTMGDHLVANGREYIWGPGRHGPGANLFAYFEDADGSMIELYTDMQQIQDESVYEPRTWPDLASGLNVWGPLPPDRWFAYTTPFDPKRVATSTSASS